MPNEIPKVDIKTIFNKLDDISGQVSAINERTKTTRKQHDKLDNCVDELKREFGELRIELAKIDTRLTIKTSLISVICGMIPPAVTIVILLISGVINF